jgi:hypothetical protein
LIGDSRIQNVLNDLQVSDEIVSLFRVSRCFDIATKSGRIAAIDPGGYLSKGDSRRFSFSVRPRAT